MLQARYFNAADGSISIKCSGVIEVPPTFYADNVGADGAVMRSLKQDRSLWVEGVERGVTDGMRWEPTDVSFTIDETGELVEFRTRKLRSTEPGTLLLELAN